jgi:hypothetical protein
VQIRYLYLVAPVVLLLALVGVVAAPEDAAPSVTLIG